MANFDILLKKMLSSGIRPNTNASREWFRKKIRETSINRTSLLTDSARAAATPITGNMYCYSYDPKFAKKLPYYDEFPLIFCVERTAGGFVGINLHYVSPQRRLIMMSSLSRIASDKKYDENTKLRLSYAALKQLSRFEQFKPTIKKYLYAQTRSKFVKIDSNEWDMAIFLPIQKFKKASSAKVWADSARLGK
jgi:hypothetical protein